jgi:Fur family transcriptional regulator, ferric uptake regulator
MKRTTQQYNAIRTTLLKAGRPLSVQEIFESARNDVSGLGIATVYRGLKSLQIEGLIVQVDLPGQSSRWEPAPEAHHHHFLCRTCDKLYEIEGCLEGLKRLLPKGYTLEEHDILLRGQCDSCTAGLRLKRNP